MNFETGHPSRRAALVALFRDVFSASEGPREGAAIGTFVSRLLSETPAEDLRVFCAMEGDALAGCICFSRLDYPEDGRLVFLLSPVAVATQRQGQGVGQALLRHGLVALRAEGIEIAMTYGDPAYYGRVGFRPAPEAEARPPLPLSMPQGWLWQALDGSGPRPLAGPSHCVAALHDPGLW